MSLLIPGANAPISQSPFSVEVTYQAVKGYELDISAILLQSNGKVRDDADMCFYGQPLSGKGAVELTASSPGSASFTFDLGSLDENVETIAIVATVFESKSTVSTFSGLKIAVGDGIHSTYDTTGRREAALILGEIYRRQAAWKFRCVSTGFDGGLASIATYFGINVDSTPATPTKVSQKVSTISLEKKVGEKAPGLVNLAKTATISLEKKALTKTKAKVAFVIDGSGSMKKQFLSGRLHELLSRIMPLAVHFDDDQELDCWAFGNKPHKLSNVTLANYRNFLAEDNGGWHEWKLGDRTNNEPEVIESIIEYYRSSGDKTPVYVIFLSDGGIKHNTKISKLINEAANLPIFWQFVGLGGKNYGILLKLDEMPGRFIDNANFFAVDDLHDITELELYDRLMGEFPIWLKEASAKGVITQ